MSDLIAFAGSNSSTSINYKLIRYTVGRIEGHAVRSIDMSKWDIPMYSADLERDIGIPEPVEDLYKALQDAKGLVLSVNEHNGNPSAFTKNTLDWLSRKERDFMRDIPVLLMSASPGRGGAKSARAVVANMLERFGAEIVARFSLPSFKQTFDDEQGITDAALKEEHQSAIQDFLGVLSAT